MDKCNVQGYVIHGKQLLKWDGAAFWFDYSSKQPFTVVGEIA
jgi:hypothetical protein